MSQEVSDEIVDQSQVAEAPAVGERIHHKVERPAQF